MLPTLQLRADQYRTMQEWRADLDLIWENSATYNGAQHTITKQALKLQAIVDTRMEAAMEVARANLKAQAASGGEAPPKGGSKKSKRPRSMELTALLGVPVSSDTDSLDDAAGAVAGGQQAAAKQQQQQQQPQV